MSLDLPSRTLLPAEVCKRVKEKVFSNETYIVITLESLVRYLNSKTGNVFQTCGGYAKNTGP